MNKPEGLADAKKHIKRYKNKMGKIRHQKNGIFLRFVDTFKELTHIVHFTAVGNINLKRNPRTTHRVLKNQFALYTEKICFQRLKKFRFFEINPLNKHLE